MKRSAVTFLRYRQSIIQLLVFIADKVGSGDHNEDIEKEVIAMLQKLGYR